MAGDSPTRGGFRKTPPVPTYIRISPLKLPGPSRPALRRQPPHDSPVSKIPVPKVKRPSFRPKPEVDDPFISPEPVERGPLRSDSGASVPTLSTDDSVVEETTISDSDSVF
ncbi:hypothetical protein CPB83DRAFT_857327 [Crepidotus variabilis]|uniref:Uncharacterized protein n=1 Tax=Crepidotus variabilis TaxID=179855 RepID=A0A9P6EC35_9AGAR|nr:hypothetical protein CPB83DRAFT_857327 [Crepidotus variabilis]